VHQLSVKQLLSVLAREPHDCRGLFPVSDEYDFKSFPRQRTPLTLLQTQPLYQNLPSLNTAQLLSWALLVHESLSRSHVVNFILSWTRSVSPALPKYPDTCSLKLNTENNERAILGQVPATVTQLQVKSQLVAAVLCQLTEQVVAEPIVYSRVVESNFKLRLKKSDPSAGSVHCTTLLFNQSTYHWNTAAYRQVYALFVRW